jgi:ATP-dependent DNA helicase RecG
VARLKNFTETSSGFELAEIDLRERGAGSLISKKQSGLSDIAMEALKNLKLVETAKEYAKEIIGNDKHLENFPELAEKLEKYSELHLE